MGERAKRRVARTLLWRRFADDLSMDWALVRPAPEGLVMGGTILSVHDGEPFRGEYLIHGDGYWRTERVTVRAAFGKLPGQLELVVNGDGRWQVNGEDRPDLDGCIDVDLEETPATNSLPINRLGLAVGEKAEVLAAWVRFPSLTVERARQIYTRLSLHAYQFKLGDFEARIDVDEDGMTTTYEGLWRRVADSPAAGVFGIGLDGLDSAAVDTVAVDIVAIDAAAAVKPRQIVKRT